MLKKKMASASVVDLFCGVGGMTHGFVHEGFKVVAGIDVDPTCKYPYEKNNRARFILRDIQRITSKEVLDLYPRGDVKILIGCAPCQPFSKYSNPKSEDDKWRLLLSFAELIRGVKPEIVSMENVPQLEKHRVFKEFIEVLREQGYYFSWSLVDCVDYGVPQNRTRLVLFASMYGDIRIINRTHPPKKHRTVSHAIRRLEPIRAGGISPTDPLHRASGLSDLNLRRIMATPPGGSWKDWPEDLVLECHKKESGRTYRSVYGRMLWDQPAPTMTTQCYGLGNGRFGHPQQHRAISLRESALLQTFPKSYDFIDPKSEAFTKIIARHIGNAVPVRLGRIIGRSIKRHLEALHGQRT